MNTMKILVLGGTGAMGTHLLDILSQHGADVTVTSRSHSGVDGTVRYLKGNAHDIGFLLPVLDRQHWAREAEKKLISRMRIYLLTSRREFITPKTRIRKFTEKKLLYRVSRFKVSQLIFTTTDPVEKLAIPSTSYI